MGLNLRLHYGSELAMEMALTTRILTRLILTQEDATAKRIYSSNKNLLTTEAARVKRADAEKTAPEIAPLGSVVEGIQTLNQVFSILLSHKIPGIDEGADAIKALVYDGKSKLGIPTEFTKRVPIGVTAPVTLLGRGFPETVSRLFDGSLGLSEFFKAQLREYYDKFHAFKKGAGICPMASIFLGKNSILGQTAPQDTPIEKTLTGIQLSATDYNRVLQIVHKMRVH